MRIMKDSVVLDVSESDFKDGFCRFGWTVAEEPKAQKKAKASEVKLEEAMNPPVVEESASDAPNATTVKKVRVSSKK